MNRQGRTSVPAQLPRELHSSPTSAADLGSAVKRGAVWTAGSNILLRLGNIVVMAVVARIVSPNEFGIFTLAVTVHAVVVSFAELGTASAIARSDLKLDRIAPTVVFVSSATSLLMAIPIFVFSSDIASLLGSAEAGPSLQILALGVALIGPLAVPGALLLRDFRQNVIFWATAIAFIPGSASLVLLALQGAGPEAFAWSRIVSQVVTGIVLVWATGRPILPRLDLRVLKPLLAFGLPLAGANLLSQVLLNADYIFVGRMIGATALGVYFLAFNIAMWPTAVIGSMLNGLVLPAISVVRRDGGDVAEAVRVGLRTVALVAFPIAAFLGTFSGPLVQIIYGHAWDSAAPVVSVLALYGAVSVVGLFLSNVLIATGRTAVLLGVQVCALIALIAGLPVGIVLGGIEGAATAHVLVIVAVTSPAYIVALRRATGIGLVPLLGALARPALTSLVTASLALVGTLAVADPLWKILVGGTLGAVIYALFNRQSITSLVPKRFRPAFSAPRMPSQTKGRRRLR